MSTRGHVDLPAIGVLSRLSAGERANLSEAGHSLRVKNGDLVVTQGKRQDTLYLVLEGRFEATREKDGKEVVIAYLKVGETFGEMSIIDPATASAGIRAIESSLLWAVKRSDLDDFILRNPDTGLTLLWSISGELVKRLRLMDRTIADFATERAE